MTHQPRTEDTYPEMELSVKLSQIEGAFRTLDYMNNREEDVPRNTTERNTVSRNLARIKECRVLLKQIINEYRHVRGEPAIKLSKRT